MMKNIVHEGLKKIVKHCEIYGFLNVIEESGSVEKFKFGPVGEMLFETIRREWILSNVVSRENNVFMFNIGQHSDLITDIKDGFAMVKQLSSGELPFGLADTRTRIISSDNTPRDDWEPRSYVGLKYLAFCEPTDAEQFFYSFQQQRKRWWRKFSSDPSKFSFSEIEKRSDGVGQEAKILAEFPWGLHCVEKFYYHGSEPFGKLSNDDQNVFSIRSVRKKRRCMPSLVECTMNLDYAAFTYICDAYTVKKYRNNLKFHRKLAPYKFAFAAEQIKGEESKDLYELAEVICLGLRNSGLVTLLPAKSEFAKKKLDIQLLKSDSLGVPYTIVLSPETLKTGIFGLYSRDTTLQEQVHVSQMEEYGVLLMKNY